MGCIGTTNKAYGAKEENGAHDGIVRFQSILGEQPMDKLKTKDLDLDLRKSEIRVVRGKAYVLVPTLKIEANQLYIRRLSNHSC